MEEINEGGYLNAFSSIANSVIRRCCSFLVIKRQKLPDCSSWTKAWILLISTDELLQTFENELSDNAKLHSKYVRNFIEFCSYKTLHVITKKPELIDDKTVRHLMFEMMLAWEVPDTETETLLKESSFCKHSIIEEEGGGSLFCISATSMAVQVDYRNTVGLEAFTKIAPAFPAIADSITAHNLFDALTSSSGGQLHVLIYDKYLKCLNKVFNSAKCLTGSTSFPLHFASNEIILDFDGIMPTNLVLQHIGKSTSPGRLTLTNLALYFERFGVGSYDKAIRYDLERNLKQVVKRELTGPWGAHLFDNAVMYKASYLTEPIFFEFPQIFGNSRRDYWLGIIREVLYAHRFVRKFSLKQHLREEALSMAILGIFRFRVIKDNFHVIPSQFRTTLLFNLTEKLPKGDKILEALYNHLELLIVQLHNSDAVEVYSVERIHKIPFPVALYALNKLGFTLLPNNQWPKDIEVLHRDVHVGETSFLQKAVRKTVCYSGRTEAAQATLDQVKVKDIDTNLAVIKELLFPVAEFAKWLYSLSKWQDSFKSTLFLLLILYILHRGWIWHAWPCILFSLSFMMVWNQYCCRKERQREGFKITAPPNRSTVELLLTLQETISQLEAFVQTGCITLLKLRFIIFPAFPQASNKVAYAVAGIAVIFTVLPLRHIVMILLLEFYTREMPLRRESSEKLIRRLREWWLRIPAASVQLIRPPPAL